MGLGQADPDAPGRAGEAGGPPVAGREPLTNEQRRLLRIIGRMPLASAASLAPAVGLREEKVRRLLGVLRQRGWVASVMRGMTERRQRRWFLTRQAVEALYVTGHQHPGPREEARALGLAAFLPEGELPGDFRERFALDHDHPAHLESQVDTPFAADIAAGGAQGGDGAADANHADHADHADHEHPPWTATSRGVETALRRLAMLETFYRLAPDLLRSGSFSRSANGKASAGDDRLTGFRLLRHGGFYHAVARYGEDLWIPFTYVGLHATERALRRKEQHRFWGVDCYSQEEDRYLHIGNRLFHVDPDLAVEPSGLVVVAADAWGRGTGPQHPVQLHAHAVLHPGRTVQRGGGTAALPGPGVGPGGPSHRGPSRSGGPVAERKPRHGGHRRPGGPTGCSWPSCQFPAMRAAWLREIVGGSPGEVGRHLERFVDTGLVAVFDGRHYLSELGMRRAANMSRILPSVIRSRHGAYLGRWYREHEAHHNDGVNRLAVRFAREGVAVVAGWRGEVNVPGLTQVRPDLLVRVRQGALGPGTHYVEFERSAVRPDRVEQKLAPYRRTAATGQPLPLLMVCETARGPAELPGRRGNPAPAGRHPGAGPGRPGHRSAHRVEPGRGPGGAALPVMSITGTPAPASAFPSTSLPSPGLPGLERAPGAKDQWE